MITISAEQKNEKMSITFPQDADIDDVMEHLKTLLTFLGYHSETIKNYINED